MNLSNQLRPNLTNKPVDPVISSQSRQAVCGTNVDIDVDKDSWSSGGVGGEWSRLHNRSRRSLFTPMRVAQGPADKTHRMRLRGTKGTCLLTMKCCCITGDLRQTSNAHRLLEEPLIGTTTTFQDVADCMVESEDSTMTADDDDSTDQPGAQR